MVLNTRKSVSEETAERIESDPSPSRLPSGPPSSSSLCRARAIPDKGSSPREGDSEAVLDFGKVKVRSRTSWWKIWIPSGNPPSPRSSLSEAPDIPLSTASTFSILTFSWVTPLMTLGYQRTLQATDLWKLAESHSSETISRRFNESWTQRKRAAEAWNHDLDRGLVGPSTPLRFWWCLRSLCAGVWRGESYAGKRKDLERRWREVDGRRDASIALALNDVVGFFFWTGGMFKVVGDTAQLLSPLVIKALINFAKKKERAKAEGLPEPNVRKGIAMAIGLFLLTILASIGQHQFYWRSMVAGILARSALIKSIYERGLHLTGKARTRVSNADLVNHISTDVSRIDNCVQWFHTVWTTPIQVISCLVLLLLQLGPSALAGFGLFFLIAPIQERAMAWQFSIRKCSMKYTDRRTKTLVEVLGSMSIVKYFSYEDSFLNRIHKIRAHELQGIRSILMTQSANIAFAFSIPVLAATLAFVTYTRITPSFDVAVIFASLSLFQLLRQPMMYLPRGLSAISDARNALDRLHRVFDAETLEAKKSILIDKDLGPALRVENASFEWEQSPTTPFKEDGDEDVGNHPTSGSAAPFRVEDIDLVVPRGSLVAVVGRVGSGKSSLLMGLIGEMRRVSGSVTFGGKVAYCPQRAWIQNASVRDNIIFGQPFEEERYWRVIEQASLVPDLNLLVDGDLTEIGEKGVNLSGGQKQRVNIARALYYDADVVIMDDPLSAVDAHVGKALFHDATLGALRSQGKTVIFATHALHFLSQCDYIYTLCDGRVAGKGSYQELIQADGEFARLDKEFGGGDFEQDQESEDVDVDKDAKPTAKSSPSQTAKELGAGAGTLEGKLIIREQRATGFIPFTVYKTYLIAGCGYLIAPFLILSIMMMQGSLLMSSYTLVWWQANSFHRPFSFYQTLYAVLGISQALFAFLSGCCTDVFSYFASQNLHHDALASILHAPMSFFDTTPMGRILGIFGKDIDNIDTQLSVALRSFIQIISIVIGAVIIITVIEHYFIFIVVVISFGYQYFTTFYRASATEAKRLDSMLRSLLYSHFSESLTGLTTIRSYSEAPRFIRENSNYIDLENRALFLTVTNQRWFAVRLDFCGAFLILAVALFAAIGVSGMSAAQVGLVLTYAISLTQAFALLIRQTAEVENCLNSVERISQYSHSDQMKQEPPHEIPENKPPADWPQEGAIEFNDLSMCYRSGLPNVLHSISMTISGGEKIGIVGRTGAGKSSITLALLRIVEYTGSITIDGVDISKIGLKDLRTNIAIIPQDPIIFSGTVRTALDPFSLYDDARLWDALRRSFLVESKGEGSTYGSDEYFSGRITLDTVLESEGQNLSVGERSLLSLARALVKDSKIVILDEATASVDVETDTKIQNTIQTEFKDRTLICIAHRLRTILHYDRILVLDQGRIMEFDKPLNLFRRRDGMFRALCTNSNITENDIEGL